MHRQRDPGTVALERGVRINAPSKPLLDSHRRVEMGFARPPVAVPTLAAPVEMPPARVLNTETANLRTVVSRFGGIIQESTTVHIPKQGLVAAGALSAMDNDTDFESRHKPACANVYAGIAGYTGFRPQGTHHHVLGSNAAPPPRQRPTSALDTSGHPYVMPVVGFTGHIRGLADADKNYGTSHWKNSGGINPKSAPAAVSGWDGRDDAGRFYGGQMPGDFGKYLVEPEYARMKAEADEANEILELRSMGIKALLKARPEVGGSRGGPQRPAGMGFEQSRRIAEMER